MASLSRRCPLLRFYNKTQVRDGLRSAIALCADLAWDGLRRVYGCVMHLDIKDGKIWIQQNENAVVQVSIPPKTRLINSQRILVDTFSDFCLLSWCYRLRTSASSLSKSCFRKIVNCPL